MESAPVKSSEARASMEGIHAGYAAVIETTESAGVAPECVVGGRSMESTSMIEPAAASNPASINERTAVADVG